MIGEYRLNDSVTYEQLKVIGFQKIWSGFIALINNNDILIEINPITRLITHYENTDYLLEMKEFITEIPELK